MSTVTLRQQAELEVTAEDKATRKVRIDAKTQELVATQTREITVEAQRAAVERANTAEAIALAAAPVVVMNFQGLEVRFFLNGKDVIQRQIAVQAIKAAATLLSAAHLALIGRVRAEALHREVYAPSLLEATLYDRLTDELRVGIKSGLVEVRTRAFTDSDVTTRAGAGPGLDPRQETQRRPGREPIASPLAPGEPRTIPA